MAPPCGALPLPARGTLLASKTPRQMATATRVRIADESILDAATEVFAFEGYDRANMDTIAARAGATKPTLYARFGSKDDLFAAAVRREYALRKVALFEAYGAGV